MTTTRARVLERFLGAFWLVWVAGCSTSAGTSGETHFQCSATPECAKHGDGLVCVKGECVEGIGPFPPRNAPPPQAAAYITVAPGSGPCNATHGLLVVPQDQRVYDALNCNLTTGCSPDEWVAIDGDPETLVTCEVSDLSGDEFVIVAHVSYAGDYLNIAGTINTLGGEALMKHYYRNSGTELEGRCSLTIAANQGAVAAGRVWVQFACPVFNDPTSRGGMECSAEGAFLFERCVSL